MVVVVAGESRGEVVGVVGDLVRRAVGERGEDAVAEEGEREKYIALNGALCGNWGQVESRKC